MDPINTTDSKQNDRGSMDGPHDEYNEMAPQVYPYRFVVLA